MGKKLVKNESDIQKKMPMPNEYDVLGIVDMNYGSARFLVICMDGKRRNSRVRGKMKKRNWVREQDIVLVSPWDFDDTKADIIFRYTRGQAEWLKQKGHLTLKDF